MAFHQGEFGLWNWLLVLFTGIALFVMSFAAAYSYLLRKAKGSWGVPQVPAQFKVGPVIYVCIILLGVVFPLFGISLVFIALSHWVKALFKPKAAELVNS